MARGKLVGPKGEKALNDLIAANNREGTRRKVRIVGGGVGGVTLVRVLGSIDAVSMPWLPQYVAENQWTYSLEVVTVANDGEMVGTGETTNAGFNLYEYANGPTGVQGNGVDVANLPNGFTLQPIATGAIVQRVGTHGAEPFTPGANVWFISEPNGVDGLCQLQP